MNAGYRRLFVAGALLLSLCVILFLIDELLALRNSMTLQAFYTSVKDEKVNKVLDGEIAESELLYSAMIEQYEQPLPELFQKELFGVNESSEYFVGADGSVVGVRFERDAPKTLSLLTEKMKGKGWVVIESGSKTQASFMKTSGHYSYAFLECFDDSLGCLAVFTLGSRG